jgi:hypothetical protein
MTAYLRMAFGKRPNGAYVPEEAWEQSLVSTLQTCGLSYAFINGKLFPASRDGSPAWLDGPYISEHRGKTLLLFPIYDEFSRDFEELSASQALEKLVREVFEAPEGRQRIVSLSLSHPCTDGANDYDAFFQKLAELCEARKGRLTARAPMRFYKTLTTQSVLPQVCFSRCYDRHFLLENREAYNIYSGVLFTQGLVEQVKGDKARKKSAFQELLKAQGFRLFSEGIGGKAPAVMEPPVRQAAYNAILQTMKIARGCDIKAPGLSVFDYDFDGCDEEIYQNAWLNCYIQGRRASVFEFDCLDSAWNYGNSLAPSLEDEIVLDGKSIPLFYTLENTDHAAEKITFKLDDKKTGTLQGVSVEKHFSFKKQLVTVSWFIANEGASPVNAEFRTVFNLSFPAVDGRTLRFSSGTIFPNVLAPAPAPLQMDGGDGGSECRLSGIKYFAFQDIPNETFLQFQAKNPFNALIRHHYEYDFYQWTTCVLSRELELRPGEKTELRLTLKFN